MTRRLIYFLITVGLILTIFGALLIRYRVVYYSIFPHAYHVRVTKVNGILFKKAIVNYRHHITKTADMHNSYVTENYIFKWKRVGDEFRMFPIFRWINNKKVLSHLVFDTYINKYFNGLFFIFFGLLLLFSDIFWGVKKGYFVSFSKIKVCVLVCIYFAILFCFIFFLEPYFKSSFIKHTKKDCIAIIKMYENALEMYDMDTPPVSSLQSTVVCSDGKEEKFEKYDFPLQEGGYVGYTPGCPYSQTSKDYYINRDNDGALFVRCAVHGTICNVKVRK